MNEEDLTQEELDQFKYEDAHKKRLKTLAKKHLDLLAHKAMKGIITLHQLMKEYIRLYTEKETLKHKLGEPIRFYIDSDIPSKKNSYRTTRSTHRVFVKKEVQDWIDDAVLELAGDENMPVKPITHCVIDITVYFGTKRKSDVDNRVTTIMDVLKDVGIIEDDNYHIVPEIHARGMYRKLNGGAEIIVYPIEE